jgi:hypothetical protein
MIKNNVSVAKKKLWRWKFKLAHANNMDRLYFMVALLEGGCRMKDSQVKLQIVLSKLAKDKFLVRVHERVISGASGPDVSIYLKIQSLKCEPISMSACKLICSSTKLQEVLGRTNLPTFPI